MSEKEALLTATGLQIAAVGEAAALFPNPIDVSLHSGEVVALSGPSGAGKSTLLRCLALLEPRAEVTLRWQGEVVRGSAVPAFRRRVVYVSQRQARWPMRVGSSFAHAMSFAASTSSYDEARVRELCGRLLLPDDILGRELLDLSGGELQRVGLVRCLQVDPQVLLLDEPTSALDAQAAEAVIELLEAWAAESRRAMVIVGHGVEPQMCNRRVQLTSGVLTEVA